MSFNKRVAFYTLGCKVNQYETESIKNQLLKKGYTETAFEEKAEIYIVNSCTVTSVADRKTRNMLRRAKKINPRGIVIVTGCYAQTNSKELLEMEEIDYVIGNSDKNAIVNFIEDIENRTMEKVKNHNIFLDSEYTEYEFATLREMSRAYVKIQDGCNNFCSYCKIPFARGKSRSRKKENIIKEIEKLVEEGFKEIILIGINLGAYGEDLDEGENFESLLKSILEINKLQRVRIGSVYPDKISDEFINMFDNKKLMPHLHISLQSCDDEVLKRMRRKYGSSLIEERLLKLKKKVKNMEYTADVIVGFPGETEEMFQNSYNLIEKIGFSGIHIFQYSDRENTIASSFTDKIDAKVKKERADRLEVLKSEMAKKERKKYIGKHLSVLLEEKINGYLYGYSENYLRVKIKDNGIEVNSIIDIKINSLEKEMLIAYE
ncbi:MULTISPECIES: tRNA (N(6)-L-threonylcarbamoyladenosine(37)-C(2))-methylthiotransferase MtaB [Fusobacterium]|jgi:threonylcarbamoyladenosine tRNA methylthiotransferase MtaB|uniref:tRNA (N(6)-L-threonylcarbamoyladenosine(37)-C(2))-methylthiotransferase MtaB n=2 Tax=Fusobacterium varium TaxID=856 RepID=A0ABN5JG18_FUSVA|nr:MULTISPECIES: tRNA (N(6)-L-threonylcarbamoyladenosine(37)-C(2))-methylthiotransferase MtaB [Fusobacterium]AVQ31016.1 tRNA (N(6)-L-threonylcarbamoyladenosine(37)-C(2))-methylthiotransferase MtaB [Fusobacterium varium ATCC 27725]EES62334.1 tRNA methylthiotransferase YqeV [Fusobacterium varium ATCC 27725]MCF2673583.1 tRNA (N(6)-L-threonylcarbamoyladenosine(37)-C(2))-methylthiotransferase MtaB [Fusobacterium varium]MCI6031635.1 tRNA (N(6)-L-threonylcarbamoyladenosine(37)-C(2))-methylthiotransfer